ncbi:MAG: hypothetical protein IPH31_00025 [Lewinellaceae bacterium]|nr:hypothetical protein [Lewinellaceae bacterium]
MLDDNSSNNDFGVHSHQSYARSWILSGNIFNTVYKIEPDKTNNNYSIFEPYWDNSKKYDLKHSISTIKNTQQNVSACKKYSILLTQNDSYEIPSGEYHKSELYLKNDCLPISLFCFDSSIGWFKDAGIIGPSSVDFSTFDKKRGQIDSSKLIEKLESLVNNMSSHE